MAVMLPLLYAIVIWWKGDLAIYDAVVLIALYGAYLLLLSKLPPEKHEGIEDLELVPRRIVLAPRRSRIIAIVACFGLGGTLIYFTAEPFLGSLVAFATALGIPTFVVIQWLAPVISEFPELASTFYFARQEEKASIALMNIVSSNINQWTLLVAMLPVVLSMSVGAPSSLVLDPEQRSELLLTISQSLVGLMFLVNMEFEWWEAFTMFALFSAQFFLPAIWGDQVKQGITVAFLVWTAVELAKLLVARRRAAALVHFAQTWRSHVRP